MPVYLIILIVIAALALGLFLLYKYLEWDRYSRGRPYKLDSFEPWGTTGTPHFVPWGTERVVPIVPGQRYPGKHISEAVLSLMLIYGLGGTALSGL